MNDLTSEQKLEIRHYLVETAMRLLGIPYEFGAEWKNCIVMPRALDCSELVEGVFHLHKLEMPDGSQAQYDFTKPIVKPVPGDLAFFGKEGNANKIYHVGLVGNYGQIIEARGFDPKAKFETGAVIMRPIENWQAYKNFVSFNAHPRLI